MIKASLIIMAIIVTAVIFVVMQSQAQIDETVMGPEEMQRELNRLQGELDDLRDLQNVRYTPEGLIYLEGKALLDRDTRHSVIGQTKLVAGVDTVELNTDTGGGRSNVSFTSALSYTGTANQINTGVHKTYSVVPIGPDRFCVESSDNTDTATVIFFVEGE